MLFSGLPEMVRTFLPMATGDSDTRNYYDMIAARQELDLRPQLERLDAFVLRSAGVDPDSVRFAFRPLWQLSASEKAGVALQKAQATQIYAGLNLWPAAVMGDLVRSQVLEDGIFPGAEAVFAAAAVPVSPEWAQSEVVDYSPEQARDPDGRWSNGGGATFAAGRLPGSSSIHAKTGYGIPSGLPTIIAGSAVAGETPEDEEEREAARKAHEDIDLSARFKPRPNGTLEPPKLPPMPGGVDLPAPTVPLGPLGTPKPLPLNSDLPPQIGPGPFAREPVPAGPGLRPTRAQQLKLNQDGSTFGCYTCGTTEPGTMDGDFIGDHQPPTSLLNQNDTQVYYPHCWTCSRRQGGYVRAFKYREENR